MEHLKLAVHTGTQACCEENCCEALLALLNGIQQCSWGVHAYTMIRGNRNLRSTWESMRLMLIQVTQGQPRADNNA